MPAVCALNCKGSLNKITGIYHLNRMQIDSSVVSRMIRALSRYIPDGIDTWQAGTIGLGHCMLQISLGSLQVISPSPVTMCAHHP
jgi:hypothetical protein